MITCKKVLKYQLTSLCAQHFTLLKWSLYKRKAFFLKRKDFFFFLPDLQSAVNGLSVYRCVTSLPAYYSGGCWCECAYMKEELRLSLDSWFVNFIGTLGESSGHAPPATALGNYAPLKCKWWCVCVYVCRWVYIQVCVCLHAQLWVWVCFPVTYLEST